jgi:hypothetical protein
VTENPAAPGFRRANSSAALRGAMVCELEGPLPILKISFMLSILYTKIIESVFFDYFFDYFSTLRYKVSEFLYIFVA